MRPRASCGALLLCALPVAAADPADWAVHGRPLPQPELLQPSLDEGLVPYRGCRVEGALEGSAPAILPQLVKRWVSAFTALQPRVRVSVPPPYSEPQAQRSERLRLFIEGKIDFAFLTRDMSASDVAAFRRSHGFDPLSIPVSGGSYRHFGFVDSVALIVNEENPVKGLTLAQLDAVLSKTRHRGYSVAVRTWGDLGVSQWADKPVHVAGTGAWAGEESARATFIRQRVMEIGGKRGEWRDVANPDEGDGVVAERVRADRYAIGFTGMGHLTAGTKTVALAAEAGGPFLEASHENVASASYPLSRVFYIVVARRPGERIAPSLDAFIRFLLSREGQREVLEQGVFIPLRAAQAKDSAAMIGAATCSR